MMTVRDRPARPDGLAVVDEGHVVLASAARRGEATRPVTGVSGAGRWRGRVLSGNSVARQSCSPPPRGTAAGPWQQLRLLAR
jgi:hypothetical protein